MTYSTVAAKGLDVGFVYTLDGGERGTENGRIIFIHAFLDEVRWLVFILLECSEIKSSFISSGVK